MSKNLFITGTGTDVGKTFVTALIVKKLKEANLSATYFKAAVSGNEREENGLNPGDAAYVKKISGIETPLKDMIPYVYENAVAPHLASRLEGNPVKMIVVKKYFKSISKEYNYVTMEGSGGIICPIRFDEEEIWLEDIIKELHLNSIIVADAGLGTINHVILTVQYMKQKNLGLKGIIFNHYHPGNILEEDNIRMVEYMTGISVVACVKTSDTELDIDINKLIDLYD